MDSVMAHNDIPRHIVPGDGLRIEIEPPNPRTETLIRVIDAGPAIAQAMEMLRVPARSALSRYMTSGYPVRPRGPYVVLVPHREMQARCWSIEQIRHFAAVIRQINESIRRWAREANGGTEYLSRANRRSR